MIYAPRALRHFAFAAMEGRVSEAQAPIRPAQAQPLDAAPRRTVVRLWLPLTPLFLLLAPFGLLLAPLLYLAPPPYRLSPFATVAGLGHLLLSLGGTVVDVDTPEALVRIRIF